MAEYTYLPWVRQGLISAAAAGAVKDGRIELTAKVDISGGVGASTSGVGILLFGPGDVTGFDARQVIRTDPPALTTDFEPNYFPLVEFDRPDFPWLFTPKTPNANNQLPPWICLIAVEKRDDVKLGHQEGQPLPVLEIAKDAHLELPDLSEAWAWAHAQVGSVRADEDLEVVLKGQPERTLSRLMCPRRLKAKTTYFACVVPTYYGGVQAGLGEVVDPTKVLDLAWSLGTNMPGEIQLPVYYHWEFSTGAQGDFEALVWQLERRRLTSGDVGTRKLDISRAGYDLPASDPVDLEGALGPQPEPSEKRVEPSANYQARLQSLLNGGATGQVPVLPAPLYGRWHAAQRSIPDVISSTLTRDRPWLRAINLDPRYRVPAGLGAQVVREQQEQLMASAWEQVGDIERANQMLRQAQLARAASTTIYQQRLGQLDAATFLLISGPVQQRVTYTSAQNGQERTARGHVGASAMPVSATSAQFRRVIRPRGALARHFGIRDTNTRSALISNLNKGSIRPAPRRWPQPAGMWTMESVLRHSPCGIDLKRLARELLERWSPQTLVEIIKSVLEVFVNGQPTIDTFAERVRVRWNRARDEMHSAGERLNEYIKMARGSSDNVDLVLSLYQPALANIADARWTIDDLAQTPSPTPIGAVEDVKQAMAALPAGDDLRNLLFGLAALMHQQRVEPCDDSAGPSKLPLDIGELKARVYEKLDPRLTIAARVGALIQAPGWKPDDLDFVLAAPDFPAPMYKALADLSQDWLLPGLEHVPPNTLALLESNPRFVEAFMVGLNHEMSRELLWRGYHTDQRGTCFRQFWDPTGRFPRPKDEAERKANLEQGKDIPWLHEWREAALGASFGKTGTSSGTATTPPVLLIRGDLLRRYPRAMIYAAKAEWSKDSAGSKQSPRNPTSEEKYPIFRGELAPDINFLGFDLDTEAARGTEQPSTGADDGAGWFIVVQQQPTEPRYGLDDTPANSPSSGWSWRDLSWEHVDLTTPNGYIKLSSHVVNGFPSDGNKKPDAWKWTSDTDSAQIACITLQGPVRVAVHASDLLPVE